MANLIPSSDKSKFDNVFNDIHDTVARDITIYKSENTAFVSTNSTYNALYSRVLNQKGNEKKVEPIVVKARISYFNGSSKEDDFNGDTGISVPGDSIRIKIDETGYAVLKQSTDIEVDGELFDVVSDASKSGMFSVKYYQIFLKRKG